MNHVPVPFDPEIEPALASYVPLTADALAPEILPLKRKLYAEQFTSMADAVGDAAVDVVDRAVPGPDGAPEVELTIISPRGLERPAPALFNIHGGGMMEGTRHVDAERLVALVLEHGAVAISVEYRLAPEHPHPAPVEDCYAGLVWVAANAAELRIDPERIVVMGGSAGGGLAAGVSLLARDRGGPALAGQLLLCPMIDDANTTVSSYQYSGIGTWTREANEVGWASLLGEAAGTGAASPYAAPSRAGDLSGLPPAFIEAGSAELFRDENVDYASRIWATGGQAELHIWGGGCHGFDLFAPGSELARAALASRDSWLRRVLGT